MSRSTGPILATGALAWTNAVLLGDEDKDGFWPPTLSIGLATGVAAGVLSLAEKVSPGLAVGVAYLALLTTLMVRIPPDSRNPTVLERALSLAGK
jgi:hypothetical protein